MFLFFNEDFDGELKTFIVDPRLEEEQHKSARQLDEFRGRFPLERIFNMSSEEYLDPRGGKDDFCHWITDGTSFVTNRLAWAKHKLLRVEFMRGPCVPEKLRPIVEEKIKGVLSPHALVGKSKYTDNLKFK